MRSDGKADRQEQQQLVEIMGRTATDSLGQPHAKMVRADTMREQATASWTDLPHEVIGTVSTFLDVGESLQSLVVVVGLKNASVIRKAYLWRNFRFLRFWVLSNADSWEEHTVRQRNVREWMKSNDDWRSLYTKESVLSNNIEDEYDATVPITSEGHMMFLQPRLSAAAFCGYKRFSDGRKGPCEEKKLIRNVGDIVVAVDGESTHGKSYSEVHAVLFERRNNETVCLRFAEVADAAFSDCFSNPSTAIGLGLVEVLQFLVEEKGVDVNAQHWSGQSLLFEAMDHCDGSMFEHLLSVDGIDGGCKASIINYPCNYREQEPLLHVAAAWSDHWNRVEALVQHESVDVNCRSSSGCNVLHYVALVAGMMAHETNGRGMLQHLDARVELLLGAGVDPSARDHLGFTALNMLRIYARAFSDLSSLQTAVALLEEAMTDG